MGAQLLKEAATKTNDVAGDGTTTATVLAQSIVTEGLKNVAAGANPMLLKRGIEVGRDAIVQAISEMSTPVTDHEKISQVASISAADAQIGTLIADVMDKVGKDGVITVEESKGLEFETEYVEGMQLDRGYLSPYFVTKQRAHGSRAGEPLRPDSRQEDLQRPGSGSGPGEADADGQARSGDHRRGCRGRGPGDPGAQQAARHLQRPGHQGPRLRRPPQGHAAGHRDPDRRPGHHRGAGQENWRAPRFRTWARPIA